MTVDLNGSEIDIPDGQALTGVAHFQIIDSLIGHKTFMSFLFSITYQHFILVPGEDGPPATLSNGRFTPPNGLSFQIDMKSKQFLMEFATSFDLFGNRLQLAR